MAVEDSTVVVVVAVVVVSLVVVATAADIGVVAGELTHLTRNREASLFLDRQLVMELGCLDIAGRVFKTKQFVGF